VKSVGWSDGWSGEIRDSIAAPLLECCRIFRLIGFVRRDGFPSWGADGRRERHTVGIEVRE
jgi:hypothetical protein